METDEKAACEWQEWGIVYIGEWKKGLTTCNKAQKRLKYDRFK